MRCLSDREYICTNKCMYTLYTLTLRQYIITFVNKIKRVERERTMTSLE